MIYFDNAATSWPKPESVYHAVEQTLRNSGNAGRGGNAKSLAASRILLEARSALADLFAVPSSERIVFTQNVTEALNLALKGKLQRGDHVLISPFEHNSVVRVLEHLQADRVITYSVVPFDFADRMNGSNYLANPSEVIHAFESMIQGNTKMICVTHASNVLGAILPIAEIGQLAKANDLLFLVDAAQTAGVLPINVQEMQIDLLAFTGHKGLLGPQGTGGLYIREGVPIKPLIYGGTGSRSSHLTQPDVYPEALESGTRNLPGIAGLTAGVLYCNEHLGDIRRHELKLLEKLIKYCKEKEQIELYGPWNVEDRVGLLSFNILGKRADEVGYELEQQYGIATRTGLHCSPLAHKTVNTLECGSVRVSVGAFSTEEEIDKLIEALEGIVCC